MKDLSPALQKKVDEFKFPGLVAAVVRDGKVLAEGAAGVRKAGSPERVALSDKFHIGSCTKSMTSLLAALLAKDGKITLDQTVGEILPDWKIAAETRQITLEQLLQHRSGLGNKPNPELWRRAFEEMSGPAPGQRREFLLEFLQDPPNEERTYLYSNFGYALAGAMIERALNKPWEDLMRKRIFQPLGLHSAGFGSPSSLDKLDQPWGHRWKNEKATPMPPGDNPVVIAPAGTVHMSILDLANYAAFHAAAARGDIPELHSMREALYSPPAGSEYALGWVVVERDWAKGKALTHAGSNTMFYTLIWIAPELNFACVLATNIGDLDDQTGKKCDRVIGELIRQFIQ